MKRIRLQAVCLYGLLIATAGAHSQSPDGLPAPGEVTLSINADGGSQQQLEMPLADNDQGKVILSVASVNEDPRWGPTINVCILGTASTEQACLRFTRRKKEDDALTAMKSIGLANGKALLRSDTLPGRYHIGEKIKIGIRLGTDSVEFRLNDGEPIMQSLTFAPRILRMGCSSALCTYRVQ